MTFPGIEDLVARGATFVINHSGGKDSQAMFTHVASMVPRDQIIVIHASLGRVEWDGAVEHIEATTGAPPIVCRSRRELLDMVKSRGKFPSPQQRQCTSDLKRGPIERTIRQTKRKLIVNCMGMRAEESPKRAKLTTFKFSARNSKAGREWYDWLPIHDWPVAKVFQTIRDAGQEPHPVYAQGMTRFSCCFCIMASQHDLVTAAKLNPTLYREYVLLERKIGQTMLMPTKRHGRRTLEQVTGVYIEDHQPQQA